TIEDWKKEPGATGLRDQYKDHTDPKYVGPGTWNVIHRLAFQAQDHDNQMIFIKEMTAICSGFPCPVCRGHCKEYIATHPMEDYLQATMNINGKEILIGMFVWAWRFHNAVNTRLKKPLMSWETAYNMYSGEEDLFCSESCLETAEDPPA